MAPSRPDAAAVVLAAGLSRRFGRASKLHARLWGKPLVAHAIAAALGSRARRVLVVTGRAAARTRSLARREARRVGRRVTVVHARHHRRGMGWSLAAAARRVPLSATGTLVCPGDMPALTPAWLDRVLAERGAGAAVRPVFRGEPAHPVWLGRALLAQAVHLQGDVGLKPLLAARPDVARPPVPARFRRAATVDVDTPRALRRLAQGRDPRRQGVR